MRRWLWFMLLFTLLIMGCSSPEPDPDNKTPTGGPTSGSLSVLTYNVWGLPSEITGTNTNERLQQIGPMLKDFDLIGVQELFLQETYKDFQQSDQFRTQRWFDKLRDDRVMGSGLLVLARLASTLYKTQHFTQCNGVLDGASDCLASKGFQMVRLQLAPGVELDFYNSHFEAGKGEKDQEARRKNLLELRAAMQRWSANRAVLFVGDTNLKNERPVDKVALAEWLSAEKLRDACEEVSCKEPGRIDRIFVRSSANLTLRVTKWWIPKQFVDKDGKELSDHDPIAANLSWERKVSSP